MSVQKRNRTKTILNSVTIFWTEFKYMYTYDLTLLFEACMI